MAEAIVAGGGQVVPVDEAEGLVWAAARNPDALKDVLDGAEHLSWIQLPFAGIENFIDLVDDDRLWTCGKGVYAQPVAELALALALAGMAGHLRTGQDVGRPAWCEPPRRQRHHPRRRRHHRGAHPPARPVRLSHHRGTQSGAVDGGRR